MKPTLKSKHDPQIFSSYRPVSNLSFLSKILETIMLNQLMEYLNCINALPDNQSAYRNLHSTESVLCCVQNNMLEWMDEGKYGIIILLDLSAAFDTVVHKFLLQDLRDIGVMQGALMYLESYLENRSYSVQVGNSLSEHRLLEGGVPQGSVLGPILFCIYKGTFIFTTESWSYF